MVKIPTVRVKHKVYKIEMIINESDFDDKLHEKIDVKVNETVSSVKKKKDKDVDAELKALMGE